MTHKVLKSCRSKMSTLAHDVCDVHGASSLYMKTCWQSSLIYVITYIYIYIYIYIWFIYIQVFPYWGDGGSPPIQPQICSFPPPPHQIFIPSHQKTIQPNKKIKRSFLAVVIAPVPFLFEFHTLF